MIATSKYLAYRTDADAAVICLDEMLAREDKFIESVAMKLGVDPPPGPIDFVWDPVKDSSDPWVCPATDCYKHDNEGDLSLVVSDTLIQHHELVHVVDIQGLGHGDRGHLTLSEGLADYLGTLSVDSPRDDFSDKFRTMLATILKPIDYDLAMHFVGSIFEQHGAEKYRAFRDALPSDAGLDQFAAVFADIYGHSLDDALDAMNGEKFYGIDDFPGCDGKAPAIAWTAEGLLDTEIKSSCGDPWFFGGGFSDGIAGFYGYYAVDVPQPGNYELTVRGLEDGPAPLLAGVRGRTIDKGAVASLKGETGTGLLQGGQYILVIAFPPRSEAMVRFKYLGPP